MPLRLPNPWARALVVPGQASQHLRDAHGRTTTSPSSLSRPEWGEVDPLWRRGQYVRWLGGAPGFLVSAPFHERSAVLAGSYASAFMLLFN